MGFMGLVDGSPARGFVAVVEVFDGAFCETSRCGPPYGHAVKAINTKPNPNALRTFMPQCFFVAAAVVVPVLV